MKIGWKELQGLFRFSYFAVVIVSAFLSALLTLAIQMATGIYVLAVIPPPLSGLFVIGLLSVFTVMASKDVFGFTKKDAAGLALALLALNAAAFLFLYVLAAAQGMEMLFWKTLFEGEYYTTLMPVVSALASAFIYYGLLRIFLDEKRKR